MSNFNITQEDQDDPIYMGLKQLLAPMLSAYMNSCNIDEIKLSLHATAEGINFTELKIF